MIVIAWLSSPRTTETYDDALAEPMTMVESARVELASFAPAFEAVVRNCSMCHAREPVWDGIRWAPKAVYLETPQDVARQAQQVYLQAGASHAMPPPNAFAMPEESRAHIAAWYRDTRSLKTN